MTGIVIGPGNITTSAMLGANYGYDMIRIIIPIILMAIIFMMVSYRISMLTGMPLLHAIRHYYGNAAAAFCGVCLFLTCFFFTMGNVSGTGAIVLVGAIVLNPTGTAIKAPAQLAELLVPIMGTAARFIMGIALVGAGFSSLLGNTQRGVVLLGAGIDKEYGLESKFVRYGCLICIVVATVICFSYGGSPTQLIFIANVLTSIATPTAGFFILRLIFRKDVNEGYGTPKVLQWGMVVCYIFAVLMTISGLSTQIPNLLRSFGLIA
ncbi:MAG: divalent metal cation transporter [Lachnospiraceae bacterium]|nr:divalent metal cation transporter [Lachnospiraceae bacterium]